MHVLLADDDEAFRTLVAAELRRTGHEVMEAADGAEALEAIADRFAVDGFDVVIADNRMPFLSGLHILASLRGLRQRIAAILVTGCADRRARAVADQLGATILDKPFDMAHLRAAIELSARDARDRAP